MRETLPAVPASNGPNPTLTKVRYSVNKYRSRHQHSPAPASKSRAERMLRLAASRVTRAALPRALPLAAARAPSILAARTLPLARTFCSAGTIEVPIPELGAESISEGGILSIAKKVGDYVAAEEMVAEIETGAPFAHFPRRARRRCSCPPPCHCPSK